MKIAGFLAASVGLRHPARPAQGLLQGDAEADVAVALAKLADAGLEVRAVGEEEKAFAPRIGSKVQTAER